MKHLPRRPSEYALTIGAVLGTLCIAWTLVAAITGVRPLIFSSGSMAPTIPTGAVGFARSVPATDLVAGDVVSLKRTDGSRVTHRIERVVTTAGNSATLQLKGDANPVADPQPYVVTRADRLMFSVPGLGYVASGLMNRYAIALEVIAALALLYLAFGPDRRQRHGRLKTADWWQRGAHAGTPGSVGATATGAVAVVAVVATVLASGPGGGQARAVTPLSGTTTATGTLTSGRPANPTSFTCTNNGTILGGSATLSWPNPTAQHGYTYVLTSGSNVVATVPPSSTDPQSITISYGLLASILGALLGSTATITITNKVGNFASSGTLSQGLTVRLLLPTGVQCATPGTVNGTASRMAQLAQTSSSSSSSSSAATSTTSSSSTTPTSSASSTTTSTTTTSPSATTTTTAAPTTTTNAPTLPPGGDRSPSGGFAAYEAGEILTIRDTATGASVYTQQLNGATATWQPAADVLVLTSDDGSVTDVKQINGKWSATQVSGPTATSASTQTPTAAAPAEQTSSAPAGVPTTGGGTGTTPPIPAATDPSPETRTTTRESVS